MVKLFSVLYTYDYFNNNDYTNKINSSLVMLLTSIISVIREFNDMVNIIIYTTDLSTLKEIIMHKCEKLYNMIEFRFYDCNKYSHKLQIFSESLKRFNLIGHSRHYLIRELMVETKLPIIYMDNDTGFALNSKNNIINKLLNSIKPVGYSKEEWNKLYKLIIYELKFNNLELEKKLDEFNNVLLTLTNNIECKDLVPINNGVLFFPYNKFSFFIINEIITFYTNISKIFVSMFNDMISTTIIFHKYKCLYTIFNENLKEPIVIHYYYTKKFYLNYIIDNGCKIIENFTNNNDLNNNIYWGYTFSKDESNITDYYEINNIIYYDVFKYIFIENVNSAIIPMNIF